MLRKGVSGEMNDNSNDFIEMFEGQFQLGRKSCIRYLTVSCFTSFIY